MIFSLSSYKAPIVDGFQPIFFKNYWELVSNDVWQMVSSAFSFGSFDPTLLAETLTVSIPLVDAPMSLKDFRPISLCNVLFKVISKVLVNRIRPHLDQLIGPLQSSFIPKRDTLNMQWSLKRLSIICTRRKEEKKGMLCLKLILKKLMIKWTYCNFLRITLKDFGFPPEIITLLSWIVQLLLLYRWSGMMRSLRILLPRGVWDKVILCSPIFLCYAWKSYQSLFNKKFKKISGYVSWCLFHLFFCRWEVHDAFCHALGLKINIHKSRFMTSRKMSNVKVDKFISICHFQHTCQIRRYLGSPILTSIVKNVISIC